MKKAFCIPVYKIRTVEHVLNHVNDLAKEFDVFVCPQTSCPEDLPIVEKLKENWADNVYIEVCDCDNIAAKRYCMVRRMIDLGYDGMFMCDDDIKYDVLTTEGCEKRNNSNFYYKKKVSIIETGKKMIEAAEKYNAVYVGTSNNELQTASAAPGTVMINRSLLWTCYVYIDLIKHVESGCDFIQVFDTFEQHDIQIQYILKGYNTVKLCTYCFVSSQTDVNSAIFGRDPEAHSRKLDTLFMNLFLKYGDFISLHYRNKTKLAYIGCRMRWDRMMNNDGKMFLEPETERTKELHEIAKTGNLDNFLNKLKNK